MQREAGRISQLECPLPLFHARHSDASERARACSQHRGADADPRQATTRSTGHQGAVLCGQHPQTRGCTPAHVWACTPGHHAPVSAVQEADTRNTKE